jgi:hypothetical protein
LEFAGQEDMRPYTRAGVARIRVRIARRQPQRAPTAPVNASPCLPNRRTSAEMRRSPSAAECFGGSTTRPPPNPPLSPFAKAWTGTFRPKRSRSQSTRLAPACNVNWLRTNTDCTLLSPL